MAVEIQNLKICSSNCKFSLKYNFVFLTVDEPAKIMQLNSLSQQNYIIYNNEKLAKIDDCTSLANREVRLQSSTSEDSAAMLEPPSSSSHT